MMKEAILVIDMLEDFVRGELKCERANYIIEPLQKLLSAAREKGVPVIYVSDAHLPDDPELKKWGPHAMAGTPGAEVIEELAPQEGDTVLGKRTYSGFYETGLNDLLRAKGVEQLYVAGLHTHICARHTAAGAFFRGYSLVGVTDGLEAFTEEEHKTGLDYLEMAYGAKLQSVDEIIPNLQKEVAE